MNYAVFSQAESEPAAPLSPEEAQAQMERILRGVCARTAGGTRINEMLAPEFAACSAAEQTAALRFALQDWMLNPKGTLHGGIMSTMLDMTMGVLARWSRRTAGVSTVTLAVSFLRPATAPGSVTATAHVERSGRTVSFLTAKLHDGEGRLCATATATFM